MGSGGSRRDALDPRAQGQQALVDALVAAVDVAHVVDLARALRADGGDQHRHAGADVRAGDARAAQLARADHDRPVRVADRDLRAHRDQLVHEEQAVLEHLLEDQDAALGLGGERDGDRREVGRERGPRAVLDLGLVVAGVALDAAASGRRGRGRCRPPPSRSPGRGGGRPSGSSAGPRRRSPSIRSSPPVTPASAMNEAISMWSGETVYSQPPSVATPWTGMTLEPMPSIAAPILLSMRATSCTCGSQAALRMIVVPAVAAAAISAFSVPITDGSSMKKSHGLQAAVGRLDLDVLAVLDGRAERAEGVEVRVQPAAADHVAARRRHRRAAEARQQRAGGQERGADALGERGIDLRLVHVGGAQHDGVGLGPLDRHAEVGEQLEQGLGVADPRHVVQRHPLLGEQRAGQQRQRGVLVSGGHDGAGQRHAAFDHELLHRGGG